MPHASVFQWIEGNGIIILAPGSRGSSEVRAEALNSAAADGGLAYAIVNGLGVGADSLMDDFEQLGAPSGYVVDLITEDDATIEQQLANAGIIVIESGKDVETARSALIGAAERGIRIAYEQGAVILVEGLSALLFGRWAMREDHVLVDGFDWLSNALLVPTTYQLSELVRPLLVRHPQQFAVGIGEDSALALGPGGQVAVLGYGQISVTLGTEYGQSAQGHL